ncbi:MAG: hypothetical protein DMF61_04380 [Blastocatellia bacterium AA13]|nr:MAG: hypothetical protein DMF61_04380 [Blastocatellia bacterium AA13]
MATETVNLQLDSEAARVFRTATPEEQKKMEVLLSIWLKEISASESLSLKEVMNDIGRTARERGLTPEILESLLNEE